MPVIERVCSTVALRTDPPAFSAHGFIQFAVPQPPIIGTVASTIATSVNPSIGGRKTLTSWGFSGVGRVGGSPAMMAPPLASAAGKRVASQRGDSGTANHAKMPSRIGLDPTYIAQRQLSGVVLTSRSRVAKRK